MPILTDDEIKMLINAECHDPFIYLGLRKLDEKSYCENYSTFCKRSLFDNTR